MKLLNRLRTLRIAIISVKIQNLIKKKKLILDKMTDSALINIGFNPDSIRRG